ncbi:MAG: phosphoribosylanthranilate isomerase [Rhodoferax sp.]|nr:phosphoribosylanthranilate isomerase [Rhodoferax sp.]
MTLPFPPAPANGVANPAPHHRTRVKLCGFTREQDIDAAVAAGADAIGFVLYDQSARFVTPERAAELARRLPPFVTPVLLFVNQETIKIRAALAMIPGAMAQFHGDESPADCVAACAPLQRCYMKAARIPPGAAGQRFDLLKFAQDFSQAQAILLDTQVAGYGGGGQTFNWSLLPPNVNAHLVLSGGLEPANVIDGIRQLRPRAKSLAVDVSSGIERPGRKGIKDAARMRAFIDAVRQADQNL